MRSRADFRKIQGGGKRVNTRSFVLLLSAQEPKLTTGSRLGITASKRVGNAVVRNRVKRVVRDAFRHSGFLFEPCIDVVVIARPSAAALGTKQVLAEWQGVASRLKKAARDVCSPQRRAAETTETPGADPSSPGKRSRRPEPEAGS